MLSDAEAGSPVGIGLAWASDWLEINNHIISKNRALCHNVEMVAITVLVGTSDCWAPLRVSVVRTQVCHHYNDALARNATRTARGAGRLSRRGQVVAFTAARAAPRRTSRVVESLGAGSRVDPATNSKLLTECKLEIQGIITEQCRPR